MVLAVRVADAGQGMSTVRIEHGDMPELPEQPTPPPRGRQAYLTAGQKTSLPPKGSRGLGGARGFEREKDDFYPTPPALSEPLIVRDADLMRSLGSVWEPACGDGAIVRALQAHDIDCIAADLVDRGCGHAGRDFLLEWTAPAPSLITNPPFRLWREFAEHATGLLPRQRSYIALLGRLQLLEGKRVSDLFRRTRLSRVMVSAGRVNMLPEGAVDQGHNGMIAWAWFVWLPGHLGPPTIEWFTPKVDRRRIGHVRGDDTPLFGSAAE